MNITKRQPVSVGEMITDEFLVPMGLTQGQLAEAMGVSRKTINELCTNRRAITVDAALTPGTRYAASQIPGPWQRLCIFPVNFSHSGNFLKTIESGHSMGEP